MATPYSPPPGATQNEFGYWILPNGDFAPGQDLSGQTAGETAAQRAAEGGPVETDPTTGKQYRIINGQKWYLPPASGPNDPGGGLVHGRTQWNPQTGAYDTPIDWGKILTMVTAGIITAGVADAALASTPALAATAPTGASASASAPVLEGVAAGGSGATTVPAAAAASAAGPSTAANIAATSSAISVPPALTPSITSAATSGVSYGDLLKYGLPVAGNLIGGILQANATGNASDAQQKYLQEALDYQKEQDTYNRNRQATLDAQEVTRYGNYQGRIAPFIANGTNANDRMSALLGLPGRAPGAGGSSSSSSSSSGSQGVALSPEISAANLANYKALGLTPSGRGTGPTDSAYYDEQIAATGGLTDANKAYWFGPNGRIAQDAAKAGTSRSYGALVPSPSTPAPPMPAPNAAPVSLRAPDGSVQQVPADQVAHYTAKGATPVDTASSSQVQMRGPDGSVKTVSADQVDHYKQLGATVLGAAA